LADSIRFGKISSASIDFDKSKTKAISTHFFVISCFIFINQGFTNIVIKIIKIISFKINLKYKIIHELLKNLFSNSISLNLILNFLFLNSIKIRAGIKIISK
jgi:hypothetical protein